MYIGEEDPEEDMFQYLAGEMMSFKGNFLAL